MWRDCVFKKMEELGITGAEVARRSHGRLSDKKVTRMLSGEAKLPSFDDVIEIAGALGMTAEELTTGSNLVVCDNKVIEKLQIELDVVKEDRDRLTHEVTQLKDRLTEVISAKTIAEHDNECMKELIRTKNKLIALMENQNK